MLVVSAKTTFEKRRLFNSRVLSLSEVEVVVEEAEEAEEDRNEQRRNVALVTDVLVVVVVVEIIEIIIMIRAKIYVLLN